MDKLLEILKRINSDILKGDKKIMTDGLVDSVDLVEIVTDIEEAFRIDIPIDEISPENFDSVESIWKMIEKLK